MERSVGSGGRSGTEPEGSGVEETLQFQEEIQRLMCVPPPPPESGNSFTALLELPSVQAMELLHSSNDNLVVTNSRDLNLSHVKNEPYVDNNNTTTIDSNINNSSSPFLISNPTVKRKDRDRKVKGGSKKSKKESCEEEEEEEEGEKLPYVHVRARRGQATDSHSLAERARREKINARMKLLQELVPGCNKISGTALVLDEIINHVQSLQRQVEFLSMRLAAVNPKIDFNLDSLVAAESGSFMDSNFPSMLTPVVVWSEVQINGNRQQYPPQWQSDANHQPFWVKGEDNHNHNFLTPENSLLSYDSSANSASLLPNQLKMEL